MSKRVSRHLAQLHARTNNVLVLALGAAARGVGQWLEHPPPTPTPLVFSLCAWQHHYCDNLQLVDDHVVQIHKSCLVCFKLQPGFLTLKKY